VTNDLTVIELKAELRKLGLSSKNELITCLNESIPSGGLSNNQKFKRLKIQVANKGSIHGIEVQSESQARDIHIFEMELILEILLFLILEILR
jgi:hypothetical protein